MTVDIRRDQVAYGRAVQTWDVIISRRNVRTYTDRPIAAEDLDRILEAARRTPSSHNSQPWDFVLVTDHDTLCQLSHVWKGAGHIACSAATIALVAPVEEAERERIEYDLGQATMAIALAAADLGIGSGHSSVGDQDLARKILGLPDDRRLAYMIGLGYPADRPLKPIKKPNRRPFDEVVHREHW
ncbi:MAG TPA: nitroreductase family protein [Pseudonocardiaceae bacterium]